MIFDLHYDIINEQAIQQITYINVLRLIWQVLG